MPDSESPAVIRKARKPRVFFQKQLRDEQPLSFETAERLYQLAMKFFAIRPWDFLEDQDLILMKDAESGEICYCSIMGGLGEVFSIHVYVGAESYRFLRKLASGSPVTPGDFYASFQGVYAEFVTADELTPPDRELLQAFGHSKKRGGRAPIFRAGRPGYHAWYVTESEARLLIHCLQGTIAFCERLFGLEMEDVTFWDNEDGFPFLDLDADDQTRQRFQIQVVKAPEPPSAKPQPAELDEGLITEILSEKLPRKGVLEADHFITPVEIGQKNERKACLQMALACDAKSGFAFKPELGKPGDPAADLLVRALLGAMQEGRCLPQQVGVRQKHFEVLLKTLSERLGFAVRVTNSLPAVDNLKDSLLEMMGDPGEFLIQ